MQKQGTPLEYHVISEAYDIWWTNRRSTLQAGTWTPISMFDEFWAYLGFKDFPNEYLHSGAFYFPEDVSLKIKQLIGPYGGVIIKAWAVKYGVEGAEDALRE